MKQQKKDDILTIKSRNNLTSNLKNILNVGRCLRSDNKLFYLHPQTDGNLVIYENCTNPIWATQTWKTKSKGNKLFEIIQQYYLLVFALLEPEGNFVLKRVDNKKLIWESKTKNIGQPPYKLVLQNDGNLVLFDYYEFPIWSSNTPQPWKDWQPTTNYILGGSRMKKFDFLTSLNDQFIFKFNDQMMVMNSQGQIIWQPVQKEAFKLYFYSYGVISLRTKDNEQIWCNEIQKKGEQPFRLILENNGKLVIKDKNLQVLWSN